MNRAAGDGPARDAALGDGTRCVHAGLREPVLGQPLVAGPVFATQYHLAGATDPSAGEEPDSYGRAGNPTWRSLEEAIGALDGGHCVVLPSGMAAVGLLLRTLLRGNDGVVLPSDGYYTVRDLVAGLRDTLGLRVREVPTGGPWPAEVFDGARLVLLETPSNPGLDVCDIAELAGRAHAAGALVAVDNTTATPLGQRPLELGADIVVSSDTKALTGHGDLVLGHLSARDGELADRLRAQRTLSGAVVGPFEAWLAQRSLGTLDLRLARQSANASALATALSRHRAVRGLRWPGLPDDPAHGIAAAQMRRFPGVLAFTLPDAATVDRFVEASRFVVAVTSFGGLHTSADRRERWGDRVLPGFVRLSTGCEDTDDLVRDVLAAVDAAVR